MGCGVFSERKTGRGCDMMKKSFLITVQEYSIKGKR